MNLSTDNKSILCHKCKPHNFVAKRVDTEVWFEGDIVRCMDCNAVLGYVWDLPKPKLITLDAEYLDCAMHALKNDAMQVCTKEYIRRVISLLECAIINGDTT